jgi:hypothetical protein
MRGGSASRPRPGRRSSCTSWARCSASSTPRCRGGWTRCRRTTWVGWLKVKGLGRGERGSACAGSLGPPAGDVQPSAGACLPPHPQRPHPVVGVQDLPGTAKRHRRADCGAAGRGDAPHGHCLAGHLPAGCGGGRGVPGEAQGWCWGAAVGHATCPPASCPPASPSFSPPSPLPTRRQALLLRRAGSVQHCVLVCRHGPAP